MVDVLEKTPNANIGILTFKNYSFLPKINLLLLYKEYSFLLKRILWVPGGRRQEN